MIAGITSLVIIIALMICCSLAGKVNNTSEYIADSEDVIEVELDPVEENSEITGGVSAEIAAELEAEMAAQENAQKVLDQMSLEEKVAQMFIITPEQLTGVEAVLQAGDTTKSAFEQYPVGGIIYTAQNLQSSEQVKELLNNMQSISMDRLGLPALLCVDEEGGQNLQIGNITDFGLEQISSMSVIGASGDTAQARTAGEKLGAYLSELGFNLDLAPNADVCSNEANETAKNSSFGSDPQLVSDMSLALWDGLKAYGVLGCMKYFPGKGSASADSSEQYIYAEATPEELQNRDWVPYTEGIAHGVNIIMVGHILVPKISGSTPASLSKTMITDVLRNTLGFQGIVVTDALNADSILNHYSSANAAIKAINAGADLLLMPEDFPSAYQGVLDAVNNNQIAESQIDQAVLRIIMLKLEILQS